MPNSRIVELDKKSWRSQLEPYSERPAEARSLGTGQIFRERVAWKTCPTYQAPALLLREEVHKVVQAKPDAK